MILFIKYRWKIILYRDNKQDNHLFASMKSVNNCYIAREINMWLTAFCFLCLEIMAIFMLSKYRWFTESKLNKNLNFHLCLLVLCEHRFSGFVKVQNWDQTWTCLPQSHLPSSSLLTSAGCLDDHIDTHCNKAVQLKYLLARTPWEKPHYGNSCLRGGKKLSQIH